MDFIPISPKHRYYEQHHVDTLFYESAEDFCNRKFLYAKKSYSALQCIGGKSSLSQPYPILYLSILFATYIMSR